MVKEKTGTNRSIKDARKVKLFVENAKQSELKCIMFDFDDTLYTGNVWGNWVEYLSKFYLQKFPNKKISDVPREAFYSAARFVDYIVEKEGVSSKEFVKYQEDVIYQFSTKKVRAIDLDLLRKLKSKYILTIVSNSSVPYIKYHSKELGIDLDLFDDIQQNNYLNEDRSKAVNYKDIINKYNLKPENVLVMGDSYSNDIVPALKLGMLCKHIDSVYEVEEYLNMILKEDFSFLNE